MMFVQHLIAQNDANGNPRRAFLVLDDKGTLVTVIDEGLRGRGALADVPRPAEGGPAIWYELPEIETTPSFLRAIKRGNAPWKVIRS